MAGGQTFSRSKATWSTAAKSFDEADLDAAIARFDQLSRPAPRLENAASQVDERFSAYFAARDWDAMAEMLADDFCSDDRRRVVNARNPARSGCRDREHAGGRRPWAHERYVDRHCDPRGAPRPHCVPATRRGDQGPEAFLARCARHRRDRRRRADRRDRHRSTSTTSTPPSRSSTPDTSPAKRPPTRARGRSSLQGYAALNRRELRRRRRTG